MKKSREDAIRELSLMLMYLTRFNDDGRSYREVSWTGYDFGIMEQLQEEERIYRFTKSKLAYLLDDGIEEARKLLQEYGIADKKIREDYIFRNIRQDEAEQAAEIERICFPPNEACSKDMMIRRVQKAPELFLVAEDRKTGKLAGFLNGLSTNEYDFRDEFFTDPELYDPEGRYVMLLGLDVLPEHRNQGLARELMFEYMRREASNGRSELVLTCLNKKVKMYKKMGFIDRGEAASSWGGEKWHEMRCGI